MINMVNSESNWLHQGMIPLIRRGAIRVSIQTRSLRDRRLELLIYLIPRLQRRHFTLGSRNQGRMACRCQIKRVLYALVVIIVVEWAEKGALMVALELKDKSEELRTFTTSKILGLCRRTSTNKTRIQTLINIQCSNKLDSWTSKRMEITSTAHQIWAMQTVPMSEAECSMEHHPQ